MPSSGPGNGLPVPRLVTAPVSGAGFGLTDGVYMVFIIDALRKQGASRLVAFSALAFGAALSIVFSPIAAAISRDATIRKRVTLILIATSAIAAAATAVLFGTHDPEVDGGQQRWRIVVGIILAAVYRAAVQSNPIVPATNDVGRVVGDTESFPIRRDLALSGLYLFNRLGFLVASIIVASLSTRRVENILPVLLSVSIASAFTVALSALLMPIEQPKPNDVIVPERPSVWAEAKQDIRETLFESNRPLKASYMEVVMYGIAFGQLAAVITPFYNDVVFNLPPGSGNGMKWAAYSALIGWGVGILNDAFVPSFVFQKSFQKLAMPIVWSAGAFLGTGIFIALYYIDDKNAVLVLFGFLAITTSTHNQFSLIAAVGLVRPKLRLTSLGIRATAMSVGLLIGSITGCIVAETSGFRAVMPLSAVASFLAGIFAFMVGSVERTQFAGVPTNANPLFNYIRRPKTVILG